MTGMHGVYICDSKQSINSDGSTAVLTKQPSEDVVANEDLE